MSQPPTNAELALMLLRQLYDSSEAGSKQIRFVVRGSAGKAAFDFAVENDWVLVENDEQYVRLTATGLVEVRKRFS